MTSRMKCVPLPIDQDQHEVCTSDLGIVYETYLLAESGQEPPVFFFLTITILHLLLAPSPLTPQFPQIKRQRSFLPPLKYSCSSISALNSRIATLQQTPPISFELLLTAFLSWLCSPNHSSSMWAEPLFFFKTSFDGLLSQNHPPIHLLKAQKNKTTKVQLKVPF